ncbi:MAG: pH-response regulator protein palA/rim20 [Tremellales sp. Tagirdzhanova-0007]|nr:MAG: pH-response regulator protein palA/rim20 [Tremellales sp. Tagirdzhanova-0007]
MAAAERRAEAEGIKRALGFLTAAAGIFNHLTITMLPIIQSELSTAAAAGYDMTDSFLGAMREFVLAEAQECYWQQAVLQGTYKNGLIGKLSMKGSCTQVSEYYKAALASANKVDLPSAGFLPPNWISHITVKQLHFEAAANYRLSQEDLERSRYGVEVARLKVADGLAKKGLDVGKKGVAEAVMSDLRMLQAAVKISLERAVRDNDLVYCSPVPPANQLPPILGVGMVKLAAPTEVAEPVAWLMRGAAGMGPLFSALVPYGVHLALSIYDDRKDTVVRDLDGKREELDGVAASTLQSLNLPGSIQALERPAGLPPSLVRKAEEVDSAGGVNRIRDLLAEVERISRANTRLLSESMDILDQEAHENERVLSRQPHLSQSRPPSHVANNHLITAATQYDATIKQAASSDMTVKSKWNEWAHLIGILADGKDAIEEHVPSTTASSSGSLIPSVRPLRASLENLDDRISHRTRLINEARQIAEGDDIRPQVLQEASRLAHGGSGDVKTEWFEEIFGKSLDKYDGLREDMNAEEKEQEILLERIREQNATFLSERKEDPRVKEREERLQEMDLAYWKWREIGDNAEEGIKFHQSFAEMLSGFKSACVQFLNSRRADVGQITSSLQSAAISSSSFPSSSTPSSSTSHRALSSPSESSSPPTSLPHPSSTQWQASSDLLPPPPPPPPILRSGGVQIQPRQATSATSIPVDSPRRITRSSAVATATAGRGPIGDPQKNPYSKGSRREGGGVV